MEQSQESFIVLSEGDLTRSGENVRENPQQPADNASPVSSTSSLNGAPVGAAPVAPRMYTTIRSVPVDASPSPALRARYPVVAVDAVTRQTTLVASPRYSTDTAVASTPAAASAPAPEMPRAESSTGGEEGSNLSSSVVSSAPSSVEEDPMVRSTATSTGASYYHVPSNPEADQANAAASTVSSVASLQAPRDAQEPASDEENAPQRDTRGSPDPADMAASLVSHRDGAEPVDQVAGPAASTEQLPALDAPVAATAAAVEAEPAVPRAARIEGDDEWEFEDLHEGYGIISDEKREALEEAGPSGSVVRVASRSSPVAAMLEAVRGVAQDGPMKMYHPLNLRNYAAARPQHHQEHAYRQSTLERALDMLSSYLPLHVVLPVLASFVLGYWLGRRTGVEAALDRSVWVRDFP